MYIKPVWSVFNLMVFYNSGETGGREYIKSLECQIGWIRGDYRQLEFEESVREQREKERRDFVRVADIGQLLYWRSSHSSRCSIRR